MWGGMRVQGGNQGNCPHSYMQRSLAALGFRVELIHSCPHGNTQRSLAALGFRVELNHSCPRSNTQRPLAALGFRVVLITAHTAICSIHKLQHGVRVLLRCMNMQHYTGSGLGLRLVTGELRLSYAASNPHLALMVSRFHRRVGVPGGAVEKPI